MYSTRALASSPCKDAIGKTPRVEKRARRYLDRVLRSADDHDLLRFAV